MNLFLDIDHTVSDADWRDPLMGDWDQYHLQASHDRPITEVIEFVRAFYSSGWTVIGLTARPEKWRTITMNWLIKHRVPMDELLMRPDDDYSASPDCKEKLLRWRCPSVGDYSKFIIIDDREDVCLRFKSLGFVALQVHRSPRNVAAEN